jgi:hypothetical protein
MGNCRSCGGSAYSGVVSAESAATLTGRDTSQDFFNVTARYVVARSAGDTTGKSFATLTAAEDYARRTGGIIRQVNEPTPAD